MNQHAPNWNNPSPASGYWWPVCPTGEKWTGGHSAVIIPLLHPAGPSVGSGGSRDLRIDSLARSRSEAVEGEKQDAESESFAASKEFAALEGKEQEAVEAGAEKPPALKSAE